MRNRIRQAILAHHRVRSARSLGTRWLAVLPLVALVQAPDVLAQSPRSTAQLEEVIVSARRRDELLQDVPLTVNVVDASAISDLNIRRLSDLQSVVAGLTLAEDPIAPNASLRGVRFDSFASGFNSTVEFYLNDSPIVGALAMQGLFDIAQIEVLRGPQGTLRGRASPSGAINITTMQPDLQEFNGFVDVTKTNHHGFNTRAAVNVPIIEEMLALRVAGFREENEGARVRSLNTGRLTANDSEGFRGTLRFDPVENLSFNLLYQRIEPERRQYPQVESAHLKDPRLAPRGPLIKASDRLSLADIYNDSESVQERTGLEIAWYATDNITVNYAGALSEQRMSRKNPDDWGDLFDASYPQDALQAFGQVLAGDQKAEAHELRLTTEFDRLDVVLGALYQETDSVNDVEQQTAVFIGGLSPSRFATVVHTPVVSTNLSEEKSVFGNITYHLTDDTEISAGLRYINFTNDSSTVVSGRTIGAVDDEWNKTVYMLSLKHSFSADLMTYATLGSSWRPGINTVGNFSIARTPREQSFIQLGPETSRSLELGVKASPLRNLRLNGALFYQKFDDYPYRSGGPGIYYVSTNPQGIESVETFNFVAAAPVNVYGMEMELAYQILDNWSFGALYSWSKGELDGATIPCNLYGGQLPTAEQIRAVTGGDNIAACQADFRANYTPLWTTTLQSEYSVPLNIGAEAYLRGMLTIYGRSQNDPTNDFDDVSSYNIFNLYAGLRQEDGKWEVMLYAKNLFETERVLSRNANQSSISYQAFTGLGPNGPITQGRTAVSGYREVTMTEPREFGVNVRYNF